MKKICKKCGRNRKIGKFGKLSASLDGKNPYCRNCMRSMNSDYKKSPAGKIKTRRSSDKWKKKKKKHISEYNRDYYIKNKERISYNNKCRKTLKADENKGKLKINKNRHLIIKIDPKRKEHGNKFLE